jgi:hypothetical protein
MFKVRLAVLALAGWSVVSAARAATIQEDFSSNPSQDGWQVFGDATLFRWDSTQRNLAVTWDSSQTNSYFYHTLGTILTTNDDFSVEFDLTLSDATTANYGSELAIGFLHRREAFSPDFLRSMGTSPNVAEFDYFPPSQIAASIDATLIDGGNNFYFAYKMAALNPGTVYHVRLAHSAGEMALSGLVLTNGQPYVSLTNLTGATTADFRLDVLAISSYQDDGYDDSVLAHGTVDNLVVTVPPPPLQGFTGTLANGSWRGQFLSTINWLYTLERTVDFQTWIPVSGSLAGTGGVLPIQDSNSPTSQAFYRVRAERP